MRLGLMRTGFLVALHLEKLKQNLGDAIDQMQILSVGDYVR